MSQPHDPTILNNIPDDAPISIEHVALYLGKSTRSIHRYINAGLLPRPAKKNGTQLAIFFAGDIRKAVAGWKDSS